jgi:hypothetical protein
MGTSDRATLVPDSSDDNPVLRVVMDIVKLTLIIEL